MASMRMMVEIPIPPKWKQLWDTCNLRGFIILSLSLQTLLIFLAPFRKRSKSNRIVMPLWFAYLLADWAANFAIGLISNSQWNPPTGSNKKHRTAVENKDLLAFWAPFLLVHLGGPDTITAFALEDNELWLRHLVGLALQCLAGVYVFVQSLPHNRLWVPTMLMFITGIIKYAERTRSLYLASAEDAGPDYAKLMDEYLSKKAGNLPTKIEMIREPDRAAQSAKRGNLTELEIVQYAYAFFESFKGLLVDMILTRRERNQSRDFFLNRTARDAFRVIEVELNFIYEFLFTKIPAVYSIFGAVCRFFSLATVCSAIVVFVCKSKSNFSTVDVTITYGLLFGALTLEITALIMLMFSDWAIIFLRKSPDHELDRSTSARFITWVLQLMTEGTLGDSKDQKTSKFQPRKRWSESISTYNLIYYCLHPRSHFKESFCDTVGISEFFDGIDYVKSEKFTTEVRDFIFEELKFKSENAGDMETAKKLSAARGEWVLQAAEYGWSSLLRYVIDVNYDQSLLLWHIATELCYNHELNSKTPITDTNRTHRKNAKLLSDYMLYLLIMQPSMVSAVAGIGHIRFRDTCAEAKRFFEGVEGSLVGSGINEEGMDEKQINACEEILGVWTEVPPVTVKGDRSKSLLFEGCILAKELMEIEEGGGNKWLIISKVWVELLCYGAIHCRANILASQVSRGGELITIVWLLMAHFGLGDHFQTNDGQTRVKIVVGK